MALTLRERFDGNFGALPRHTFRFQGACGPPAFFTCTGGQQLFVAEVPEGTEGGARWRGRMRNETLCVLLLDEPDAFSADTWLREASVPARFSGSRKHIGFVTRGFMSEPTRCGAFG